MCQTVTASDVSALSGGCQEQRCFLSESCKAAEPRPGLCSCDTRRKPWCLEICDAQLGGL